MAETAASNTTLESSEIFASYQIARKFEMQGLKWFEVIDKDK